MSIPNEELDRLSEGIKLMIQMSTTNLVSAGSLLCNVKDILKTDNEFNDWVKHTLGKAFIFIVPKLMRWHFALKDVAINVNMPLVPPTALIALANDDMPVEQLREIALSGEVKVDGKKKKVVDISTRDVGKVISENKQLKGLLDEKDKTMKQLESEAATLRKQLLALQGSDPTKMKDLQQKLTQTHKELAHLRMSISLEPTKERLRNIAGFEAELLSVLNSSSATFLVLVKEDIKTEEKANLASSLLKHEEMLADFRRRIGI